MPKKKLHHDVVDYPTSVPHDLFGRIADLLTGKRPPDDEDLHYAWHVVGFGLGQFHDHPEPLVGVAHEPPSDEEKEEVADQLRQLGEELKGDLTARTKAGKAIDWRSAARVLLQFLLSIL